MYRSRAFAISLFAAAVVIIGVSSSASAASPQQQGKGKNAPEVPLAAGLPVVATLTGATAYVVARARGAVSRKKTGSQSDSTTE